MRTRTRSPNRISRSPTAASARLGVRRGPAMGDVAAKLHMPFDSATQIYRTYEGAPDSTLG